MKTWFRGRYEIRIDDKGRFRMPSSLRQTHPKDNQIVITNGQFSGKHGLDLYTIESWEKLENRISKLQPLKKEVQIFQRFYLSGAQFVEYDSQSRLLIPPSLRKYASIDTNAVLVGMGDKLELWSKAAWDSLYEGLAGDFEESLQKLSSVDSNKEDR